MLSVGSGEAGSLVGSASAISAISRCRCRQASNVACSTWRHPDLQLMVSPTYLDFVIHHPAFHAFPPRRWRRNGFRFVNRSITGSRR
jgi:hypothetical protein